MTKQSSILHDSEAVRRAASQSNSIKEALSFLGLRAAGGNYKAFQAACQRHNISIPQFDRSSQAQRVGRGNRLQDSEVFIVNSTYTNRSSIKRRMFSLGVPNVCAECGQPPIWNGKPLTLQLEHINGVWNDNRLENLKILCGHCHSQTETFCGRAKNKEYFCSCGKRKSRQSNQCRSCSNQQPRPGRNKIPWPPIEDLESMVTLHGYSKTGRLLGVTDNAVRKRLCRR